MFKRRNGDNQASSKTHHLFPRNGPEQLAFTITPVLLFPLPFRQFSDLMSRLQRHHPATNASR